MKIIKNNPSKKTFRLMRRYENVKIMKKVSTRIVDDFFKIFPEEKRGRKSFKSKEREIMSLIAYDELIKKGLNAKCDCIANVKEKLVKEDLTITASFYKRLAYE